MAKSDVALRLDCRLLELDRTDNLIVVKTTVFLKDMNDFAAMNEVYARYFPGLPKDTLVEIEIDRSALGRGGIMSHLYS